MHNVVFSLEKGSNGQIHYSSDSHLPIKRITPSKISDPPHQLVLFGKP